MVSSASPRTPAAEMGAVWGAAWVTVLASAVSATAVRFAVVAELIVPEASVAGAAADSALAELAGAAVAACAAPVVCVASAACAASPACAAAFACAVSPAWAASALVACFAVAAGVVSERALVSAWVPSLLLPLPQAASSMASAAAVRGRRYVLPGIVIVHLLGGAAQCSLVGKLLIKKQLSSNHMPL